MRIAFCGPRGTGKTTLAEYLVERRCIVEIAAFHIFRFLLLSFEAKEFSTRSAMIGELQLCSSQWTD